MLPSPRPARKRHGGPKAPLSCCDACFLERTESPPPPAPHPAGEPPFLKHLRSSLHPLVPPQHASPAPTGGGGAVTCWKRRGRWGTQKGGKKAQESQVAKVPAQSPRIWGRLHKSSLLISAGVSPPLPSTPQNSSTVMGVRAHASSNLTCSERCKVLPTWICPGSPSALHLNIPKYPSGLPLESRGILKASKTGGLLKLVPVSTPETRATY